MYFLLSSLARPHGQTNLWERDTTQPCLKFNTLPPDKRASIANTCTAHGESRVSDRLSRRDRTAVVFREKTGSLAWKGKTKRDP